MAAPTGPPLNPSALLFSSTAITVQWALPAKLNMNGVITEFTVLYTRVPGQAGLADIFFCPTTIDGDGYCAVSVPRPSPTTPLSVVVTGLEPYITYFFKVRQWHHVMMKNICFLP